MKPLSKPFYIAGVQYSDAHTLAVLQPDESITITHNPNNEYDPFALEARIGNVKIGHIPRAEQTAWFYHTSHNVDVICKLLAFDTTKPPYERIRAQFVCSDSYVTTVTKQTLKTSFQTP